jgi:hypothetical protein
VKEIKTPRLRESFFKKNHFLPGMSTFLHYHTQRFQSFPLFCFFVGLLVIASFVNTLCLPLAISFTLFMLIQYWRLKSIAQGLSVKRVYENVGKEESSFEIQYHFKNESSFEIDMIEVKDEFEGFQEVEFDLPLTQMKPSSAKWIRAKGILNGGMGKKKFHSLTCHLTDPLSMFKFEVSFFQEQEVLVYPKIESIENSEVKAYDSAFAPGPLEVKLKGESSNFVGTRPYRYGDLIKYINWKLSCKTGELIVNEFERISNSRVCLLMNMNELNHMGQGVHSTWEYVKDISLSLSSDLLSQGHEVQVLSQFEHIPFGRGQNFFNYLALKVCQFETLQIDHNKAFIEKMKKEVPHQGTLYYITPLIVDSGIYEDINYLIKLIHQGHHVNFIFISPFQFSREMIHDDFRLDLGGLQEAAKNLIEETKRQISASHSKLYIVDISEETHFAEAMQKEIDSNRISGGRR